MLTAPRPTWWLRAAVRTAFWLDRPWVRVLLFFGVLGVAWLWGMKTAHA